jgi:hypothetical protein
LGTTSEWKIAKVVSRDGVHHAWGAECKGHINAGDMNKIECKKQLSISKMTSAECRLRLIAWLIEGTKISPDHDECRKMHVHDVHPRELALLPEAEFERVGRLYWLAHPGQ